MFIKWHCIQKQLNIFNAKPVNSEEQARELGEYIAHGLYDGIVDFNRYEPPRVDLDGDNYSVSYPLHPVVQRLLDFVPLLPGESRERLVYPLGGGGPAIVLDRATGKIVEWRLQK